MANSLLPIGDIPDTALSYLHEVRKSSQVIYCTLLVAILAALAALPFIYTVVSVKSTGIIQSNIEKVGVFSPINGKVVSMQLTDNKKVKKGAVLLNIDGAEPLERIELNRKRLWQVQQLMHDAELLGKVPELTADAPLSLQTVQYASSWQQFAAEAEQKKRLLTQRKEGYGRYQVLFERKMISQAEFDNYKHDYEQARIDYSLTERRYRAQWNAEASQYRNEWNELKSLEVELKEQQKFRAIEAPVAGTLQNLQGIQVGSFVSAGQKIAEISPDSMLIANCFVGPSDIGLISKGQEVRFQIDAFNYNLWGMIEGKVLDISDDVLMNEGSKPMFRVKCAFNRNYLMLENGYRGYIKKGMTFTAHFSVARRSLFQLLYEKADNWLNPMTGTSP